MAQNVTNWVWEHSRAVNGSLIVLLAVAHEANGDGETEMGVAELAAKCRLGERTVQTAARDLVASGALQATRSVGRGHRTRYRVIMGNPAESAPFEELNPADPAPIPASNPAESAPFTETPQNLHPAESAPFEGHSRRSERNPAESAPLEISNVLIPTTGRSKGEVKEVPAIDSGAAPPPTAADRLCDHLADRIEANGAKRPAIGKKWRDAARLMIDRDGYTEQQIHTAIDWCQGDEFWRSNILSMPKLREKYETLRLQASRKPKTRQTQTGDLFDRAMERARNHDAQETDGDPRGNGSAHPLRPRTLPASGHR